MEKQKRVYILGAGCSYDGDDGYPLAKQFIPALERYSAKIQERKECQKIKTAVDHTVALLRQSETASWQASTVDQLVDLIFKHRCDDQIRALIPPIYGDIFALRYHCVRQAKIATAACFLDLEKRAREKQADKYRRFIAGKVLNETGTSDYLRFRLNESTSCVLSFNYDRLFEHALFAHFADNSITQYGPYSDEVLNSGLTVFGKGIPIKQGRFCFLKLHGCIGARCGDSRFGQDSSHFDRIDDWKELSVVDNLFFVEDGSLATEPFMAFPYEKDHIVSGNKSGYTFHEHIVRVWDEATKRLQEASEIWIVGYSFDFPDAKHLVSIIKQANNCRKIVIQNLAPECERIAAMLKFDHDIKILVESHPPF